MSFGFEETPEEKLLKATLALPEEQRDAFMRQGAGDDEELYQNAHMLLQGYEEVGGDEAASATAGITARKRWATSAEEPGTAIGAFTLVRKVGQGGMGSVWEAEQKEPIARRVALKLIKRTPSILYSARPMNPTPEIKVPSSNSPASKNGTPRDSATSA